MQLDLLDMSLQYAQAVVPDGISEPALAGMPWGRKSFKRGMVNASTVAATEREGYSNSLEWQLERAVSEKKWEQVFGLARGFLEGLFSRGADLGENEADKEALMYVTGILSKVSFEMAQSYRKEWNEQSAAKIRLMETRDAIFIQIGNERNEVKKSLDAIKDIEGVCRQLEKEVDGQIAQVLKARQELDKINDKIRMAKEWCWVPFYNLYLYVDAENAGSHWDEHKKILTNAQRQLDDMKRERAALENKIGNLMCFEQDAKRRIDANEQKLKQYEKSISDAKKNALQYSDIANFFGSVYKRLELSDVQIQVVSDVLEQLRKLFEKFPGMGKMRLSTISTAAV